MNKKDVLKLFHKKYDHLKTLRIPLGEFNEADSYQTPDGGWQLNIAPLVAITLRPCDDEPHETHGGICQRWYKEGGAFDEHRNPGWLGFPISDEEVYEGDGDQNDRISHFENGDIIWTAKNNETRIVKKMKNSALTPKRQEIIKPLKGLRSFVKRPINGLTDLRVKDMEKAIDKAEHSICYDRYRVTVFGAFSSGKSTLLNALMGADYLPSADLPTTNIITEIFRSDRFYIFFPGNDFTDAQTKALRNEVSKEVSGGMFLRDLERDGQTLPGVGISFQPDDSKYFRQVIGQLASEQNHLEKGLSKFKKLIKKRGVTVLQLGIPNLPEWLGEITLTDAPGAGSVYEGHEAIIDNIIPQTQLVLYVVESPKAGSSVDQWLCNRIVNSFHRKVFFILNKIDQQNSDEIADALSELKEHLPSVKVGSKEYPPPPRPEFLNTSALCESIANQLSDGSLTTDDLRGVRKVPLQDLTWSDEWRDGSEEERKNLAIRFLREQSKFGKLRRRIESYLHEEDKEHPFGYMAESLVRTFGQELEAVGKSKIAVLRADRSIKELEEEQRRLQAQRGKSAKEIRNALEDFRESVLRPRTGVLAKVESEHNLSGVPDVVAEKLDEKLADNDRFKRFTANKCAELKRWLTQEVADKIDPINLTLECKLREQKQHLIERLHPIFEKIDETTLDDPEMDKTPLENQEIEDNADGTIWTTTILSGGTGGALAAALCLTAASGSGPAGIFGSAFLAKIGLGTLGLGLGPIVAIVGAVAILVAVPIFFWVKKLVRRKIIEKVRSGLRNAIDGDGKTSFRSKLKEKVASFVDQSIDIYTKYLDAYLGNLDKQEKKIIADAAKSRSDKEDKIKELEAFLKELKAFVDSSVQTLRELNPGKEPIHG